MLNLLWTRFLRFVRLPSVDRLCVPGDVRDHVRVVDRVHLGEVAGVELVVTLLREREQVCTRCPDRYAWSASLTCPTCGSVRRGR